MTMCSTNTRSSLELMLDAIKQREEQPNDMPPALPVRPVSRARLPSGRRKLLPVKLQSSCSVEISKEIEVNKDECTNNGDIVPKKVDSLDLVDVTREKPLEKILEIQKSFRGHQVRCYYLQLKRGTITLQSFVRGERARKNFQLLSKRLEAVIVIQRRTKQMVDWKIVQKRQAAVITLQSAIRGWFTRRSFNHKKNFRLPEIDVEEDVRNPGWKNPETTDHIQLSPSALADLQKRLVMVETELGNKEEENVAIRRRLHQYDERWSQYEKKMKAMEKKWQDQLASLQMSLLAAKNSIATERTRDRLGNFIPIPIHHSSNADETMPKEGPTTCGRTMNDFVNLRNKFETNARNNTVDETRLHVDPSRSSFQDDSRESRDEEFRNLKLRFEVWRKDYKVRLQEAKSMLQKLGPSETKKSRKKWWGK